MFLGILNGVYPVSDAGSGESRVEDEDSWNASKAANLEEIERKF